MTVPVHGAAWRALAQRQAALAGFNLRAAFAADAQRFARFSRWLRFGAAALLFDFSRQLMDAPTLQHLLALAHERRVPAHIAALFAGEQLNVTERRAALHTALRAPAAPPLRVGDVDIVALAAAERERFLSFAEAVRRGAVSGATGMPFTDVVHLGIGGSALGPQALLQALAAEHDGPRVHFVCNLDPADLAQVLRGLSPAQTLFIIASKTFTTRETLENGRAASAWLARALGAHAVGRHFVAISANPSAAAAFGIDPNRCFAFWDWVGGRFSLWSAVGLPVAIGIGRVRFEQLLAGAHAMDEHFRSAPLADNVPVLAALIGLWNINFLGAQSQAIVPYAQPLARFVAHLQQLEMESNGKRMDIDGEPVACATAPVVWGEPGTNAQHAFFQALQQGTGVVPVDFIVAAESAWGDELRHRQLVANCFAQSAALAFGKTRQEAYEEMIAAGVAEAEAARLAPHRELPGNRPSTTILVRRLDPFTLGMLTALYEHKVFVQGVLWNINPFDQWGVELGKAMAGRVMAAFDDRTVPLDAATRGLIDAWHTLCGSAVTGEGSAR
ncbi:MAG: glucose-6-phosphate isomerase [Burkholderiaceae bacterium]|nr:glucose-6-phosphate isomerase [Burkholderiaceae bacterium]MCX7901506.1 glucose-6-phosphate isomerase [Burkholderiaceae bacterium]